MTTCPAGHESAETDFCDKCGLPLAGGAPGGPSGPSGPGSNAPPGPPGRNGPPPGIGGVPTEDMPNPAQPVEQTGGRCPDCGAARTGRFCEECGYDYITGRSINLRPRPPVEPVQPDQPVQPEPRPYEVPAGSWAAVITADPEYHASVLAQLAPDTPPVPFPPYHPTRQVLLSGPEVRIGRRSLSRGVTPEIDLGERPQDPGVSHIHAVLLARPDGSWVLVDPGSTNGTTVNAGSEPIAYNTEIPLKDGDRIHVGAWTTITLIRGPHSAPAESEGGGPR